MNFKTEFRQIIIPLLKGSPVLVLLMIAAVMIVRRSVTYMTPEYRAGGAIKINNLNYSQQGSDCMPKRRAVFRNRMKTS